MPKQRYDRNSVVQGKRYQAAYILLPLEYEEAKAYFLEMMMIAEGEERDRAECIYIQLTHGLSECSDEDE